MILRLRMMSEPRGGISPRKYLPTSSMMLCNYQRRVRATVLFMFDETHEGTGLGKQLWAWTMGVIAH